MAFLQVYKTLQRVCCKRYSYQRLLLLSCAQRSGSVSSPCSTGTSASSRHVTFRLARHSDYDAVMRISEGIYDGTDYMPAFYHSFIDDPDVTLFVAVVDDQVVGLKASKVTELGLAFLAKAARVAPDSGGRGIAGKLSVLVEEWIRQNRPTVRYQRGVRLYVNPGKTSLKKTVRQICNLPHVGYHCGPSLWWRQDPARLAQLDTTGLPDVVPLQDADDDYCTAVQKWLPGGARGYDGKPIIMVDWEPYTLCPANLKLAQAHSALYTLKHKGEVSLSIVSTYPIPSGRILAVDVYAKDFPTWRKHVIKHLYDASLTFTRDQICVGLCPGQFELEDSIYEFCRDILQMDLLHEPNLRGVVFESEL